VENGGGERASILAARPSRGPLFSPLSEPREADLPAKRAPSQAAARLPCAHGDARGPRNLEASSREGSRAALGVAPALERRHRLSRSRDFDAVYRRGRSVSTRFLVLYWFSRDDENAPRLGIAVPKQLGGAVVRNRIKRQLRETWRAMIDRVPEGNDYVLIARPGLPEAVEARGADWLRERVDEVLQKAAA
jgi:ribonuclease P protein component